VDRHDVRARRHEQRTDVRSRGSARRARAARRCRSRSGRAGRARRDPVRGARLARPLRPAAGRHGWRRLIAVEGGDRRPIGAGRDRSRLHLRAGVGRRGRGRLRGQLRQPVVGRGALRARRGAHRAGRWCTAVRALEHEYAEAGRRATHGAERIRRTREGAAPSACDRPAARSTNSRSTAVRCASRS
jgi:hypothetical protein